MGKGGQGTAKSSSNTTSHPSVATAYEKKAMGSGASKTPRSGAAFQDVRRATLSDGRPAPQTAIDTVVSASFDEELCQPRLAALWKRMSDDNWQHSFKCLVLLQALINRGSPAVLTSATQPKRINMLLGMSTATCPKEQRGESHPGVASVRQLSEALLTMLQDTEAVRDLTFQAERRMEVYNMAKKHSTSLDEASERVCNTPNNDMAGSSTPRSSDGEMDFDSILIRFQDGESDDSDASANQAWSAK